MRLHVGVCRTEQLFGPIDRELLGHVDVFAATVVTFARIPLCILVCEYRTLDFQDAGTCIVFRRDQFDVFFLALCFGNDGREQLAVEGLDRGRFGIHKSISPGICLSGGLLRRVGSLTGPHCT